jgi:8-oxo-dGTP pyrophosphatase MutT (NUDIX family)
METGALKAVGVWFRSRDTHRYLYLLRNDPKHPGAWALPGGKVEPGETLLGGMERECVEELGFFPEYQHLLPLEKFTSDDAGFEYYTWVCVVPNEFHPRLNHEHLGYAWVNSGSWPRPMHPGLWSTLNIDAIQHKIATVERYLVLND